MVLTLVLVTRMNPIRHGVERGQRLFDGFPHLLVHLSGQFLQLALDVLVVLGLGSLGCLQLVGPLFELVQPSLYPCHAFVHRLLVRRFCLSGA